MTILRVVSGNPFAITAGFAPAMVDGEWEFTWTPGSASGAAYSGFHAVFCGPAVGGFTGASWIVDSSYQIYRSTDDALALDQPLTFSAGNPIRFQHNFRPGVLTVTISGATTGNGTFAVAFAGPFFTAGTLTAGGVTGQSGFGIDGVIGNILDPAPDLSWRPPAPPASLRARDRMALLAAAAIAPIFVPAAPAAPEMSWVPEYPAIVRPARPNLNVGGAVSPEAILAAPPAPEMSWAPEYPAIARRARAALGEGGTTAPIATLPNPPAPEMSWAPEYPAIARRARAALGEGGTTAPVATLPNPIPVFVDAAPAGLPPRVRRAPASGGVFGPPPAGRAPFTIGSAAIRQNINASNPALGTLTTFGTDLTFTANAGTATLTTATHNMVTCAGPFFVTTTGTLPDGLSASTPYYARVTSTTAFQVALSAADAGAGTIIAIGDAGTGTHTIVRAKDTSPLYSTFVTIVARGVWSSAPDIPTDSFGNAYSYVTGTPRDYDAFAGSRMAVAIAVNGRGGAAHTFSATVGRPGGSADDEVVVGGVEIGGGLFLKDSVVTEVAVGSATITSGTVTTTGRALLLALVFGNGPVGQVHVFTFLDGFTAIPAIVADGDPSLNGYIQHNAAWKFAPLAGTYSFRAQGTSNEGGQLVLLAFQMFDAELQPADWMPPPAAAVRAARRFAAHALSGTTAPILPLADVPAGWLLASQEVVPRRRYSGSAIGDHAAAPIFVPPPQLDWLPHVEGAPAPRRALLLGGATEVPAQPAPLWTPIYPDAVLRRRLALYGDEVGPVLVPTPIDWIVADALLAPRRPRHAESVGVGPVFFVEPPHDWRGIDASSPRSPRSGAARAAGPEILDVFGAAVPGDWLAPIASEVFWRRGLSAIFGGARSEVLGAVGAQVGIDWFPTQTAWPVGRGRVSSGSEEFAPIEAGMSSPPLEKTWAFAADVELISPLTATFAVDEAKSHANLLRAIKDALVGTGAWAVLGSSNAVTGAVDGVDRWTTNTAIQWAANTAGARAWIVLGRVDGALQVLIDLVTDGGATSYHQWILKATRAGYTGGSASAAPTPIGEESTVVYRQPWIEDVTGGLATVTLHALRSTDGQNHRFWFSAWNVGRADVVGFLSFERLADAAAGMVGAYVAISSRGRPTADGTGSDFGVQTFSYDPMLARAHVGGVTIDGRAWSGNFYWEGFSSRFAHRVVPLANEVTGEQALYPIWAYSQSPSIRGRMGRMTDLWMGSSLLLPGSTFPADATRSLISLGSIVVPWDGSPPPPFL